MSGRHARFALPRCGRGLVVTCFLYLAPLASIVTSAEPAPRWTLSVAAVVLERSGGAHQTLVERVPGTVPFLATFTTPGTETFNSDQFRQGFFAGPKLGLMYRDPSGYGVEVSYFNVFTRSTSTTIGPDDPADWLVMRAPGLFWQTQDFPYQGMTWSNATNLYSAEVNGRLEISRRVTVLAGVRWLELNDKLVGTVSPSDLSAPTWKQSCKFCDLFHVFPGGAPGDYPPFWTTSTTNYLYGVQLGVDARIWELGHLAFEGTAKAGLFDNVASQLTGISLQKIVYPASATANRLAFAGEASVRLKYQVGERVALKIGYEVLWLAGIALAPAQVRETYTGSTVRALGVDTGSNVFFQGITFGVEYAF